MAFASVDLTIIPSDEPSRMAAVRRYEILDTPPDGAFDHITAIAARNFNVPISIISIVDEDRIWFKSRHGLEVEQIGRDPGLCASAVLSAEPWIISDAKKDIRSLANPLVAGDFGLRFYVGVPLRTSDGYNLGTLCVIDKEPRTINERQIEDLKDLAAVVMDQMELRLSARRAVGQAQIMSREIDHRVMNSLQFVSALLTIQGRASGWKARPIGWEQLPAYISIFTRANPRSESGVSPIWVGCAPISLTSSRSRSTCRGLRRLSPQDKFNRLVSSLMNSSSMPLNMVLAKSRWPSHQGPATFVPSAYRTKETGCQLALTRTKYRTGSA
jgi:GAF domain-containing protein/histidine kinase